MSHDTVLMSHVRGTYKVKTAKATLRVAVHYRKNWQDKQVVKTDRTRIGLYATDEPVSGKGITAVEMHDTLTLSGPMRILAVRPVLTEPLAAVTIEATLPSGRKLPVLNLRAARPGWSRRYWLGDPLELPAGTAVTVHVSGENPPVTLDTIGL